MTDQEFEAWRKERNRQMRELDVHAAFKGKVGEDIALCALHKARYECTDIEPELRIASREWLKERGFMRLGMLPFLPDEELPA